MGDGEDEVLDTGATPSASPATLYPLHLQRQRGIGMREVKRISSIKNIIGNCSIKLISGAALSTESSHADTATEIRPIFIKIIK